MRDDITTLRFSVKNYLKIPAEAREILESRFLIRSLEGLEYVFDLSHKTAAEVLALMPNQIELVSEPSGCAVEDRRTNNDGNALGGRGTG